MLTAQKSDEKTIYTTCKLLNKYHDDSKIIFGPSNIGEMSSITPRPTHISGAAPQHTRVT
jgi:hypothetical protein